MGIWGPYFNLSTPISSPLLDRVIDGVVGNSDIGQSVSTAGDVNNYGKDDLIIGAPYLNSNTGRAFVVVWNTCIIVSNEVGSLCKNYTF